MSIAPARSPVATPSSGSRCSSRSRVTVSIRRPPPLTKSATGPDGSYVSYLGVLESARGRGVATGLLRTIIADAASRDRDRVGLEVDADSPTGAEGLYVAMGWGTKYVTESWHRDVDVT